MSFPGAPSDRLHGECSFVAFAMHCWNYTNFMGHEH